MSEEGSGGLSGTRVRVCYADSNWYYGSIDSYHEQTGKYRISLDDGDKIFARLPDEDVDILEQGAAGVERGAAPVPAGRSGIFKRRRVSNVVARFEPGLEGKHEAHPATSSPAPTPAGKGGSSAGKSPASGGFKSPAPSATKSKSEAGGKDKGSGKKESSAKKEKDTDPKDAKTKDAASDAAPVDDDGTISEGDGETDGLRGISRRASSEPGHRRWQAHIKVGGKKLHLGVFSTKASCHPRIPRPS